MIIPAGRAEATAIDLVLSAGVDPRMVPDVVNELESVAEGELRGAGFAVGAVLKAPSASDINGQSTTLERVVSVEGGMKLGGLARKSGHRSYAAHSLDSRLSSYSSGLRPLTSSSSTTSRSTSWM